jgi:Ion channel
MFDLAATIAGIPDDVKPLAALGVGALMLVFLVMFHGAGLHTIIVLRKLGEPCVLLGRFRSLRALSWFGWSVFFLLCLHIAGVMIWAFALLQLGLIPRPYDAIYFCANAYTTLGYGNVDLDPHWRIISPIIGVSGLFTFAWTASALVEIVASHRQLVGQLHDARAREKQQRGACARI